MLGGVAGFVRAGHQRNCRIYTFVADAQLQRVGRTAAARTRRQVLYRYQVVGVVFQLQRLHIGHAATGQGGAAGKIRLSAVQVEGVVSSIGRTTADACDINCAVCRIAVGLVGNGSGYYRLLWSGGDHQSKGHFAAGVAFYHKGIGSGGQIGKGPAEFSVLRI
ncbi:hypothetical protein ADICEAN_04172 [Cesiribacter andamanensis AMV16]|uniref:Uncharacterized protein n=1 Tax=Cesiribacter andamanensis AMV16 TaxID=1279009 RepID=M7N0F8_9BACT|nr:hypothetical protein ADICEAN_04172 [Cesiribacter andamanensis AMV16]